MSGIQGKITRREVSRFYNNMVCLVKAIEGQYTTIDLRNESCVTGKINHVDAFMNVEMVDCVYYNARGETFPLDMFFVPKRNIVYVHIPDGKSCTELVEQQIDSIGHKVKDNTRETELKAKSRSLKDSRARRYQTEILNELSASTSKDT